MSKLIFTSLLALIISTKCFFAYSQKIKVDTKSIEEVDNKLVIKYDLLKSKTKQLFKVAIEITNKSGNAISISALSGDIGDSIKGGINKQIVWDYNADGLVLNEDVNIEVLAWLIPPDISLTKAIIFSTLWPGSGLSKTQRNGPYWLMGLAGYGCLGTSLYMNKMANDSYQKYLDNKVYEMNDELLSTSQSQNQLSKTMAYSAIGIWAASIVWTAVKAKNKKSKGISQMDKKQFIFYSGIDPFTKTAGFTMKFRF